MYLTKKDTRNTSSTLKHHPILKHDLSPPQPSIQPTDPSIKYEHHADNNVASTYRPGNGRRRESNK
jgi:hypothetical protein